MKKESKSKDRKLHAYFMELDSLLDLAKQIFSYEHAYVKALKDGKGNMLTSGGEKFGDTRIIYFSRAEKEGKFLIYNALDFSENAEIRNSALPEEIGYKAFRAPIVQLESSPYAETKELKKHGVVKVKATDASAFIKAIAGHFAKEESMPRVYAFYTGKDHIIGTFDLFHEGSTKIFTYAITEHGKRFNSLVYNYTNDSIDVSNTFSPEKSTIYVRVINLKKPFPFF